MNHISTLLNIIKKLIIIRSDRPKFSQYALIYSFFMYRKSDVKLKQVDIELLCFFFKKKIRKPKNKLENLVVNYKGDNFTLKFRKLVAVRETISHRVKIIIGPSL